MRCFIAPLITVMLACAVPMTTAHAEEKPTQVEALKAEIETLRAELAQLRLENTQLRKQLEAKAETTAPKSVVQEEENAGQEKSEKVIKYESADEIFKQIPEELSPQRDGWTRTEADAVKRWMRESLPGSMFSARRIVSSTKVSKNPFNDSEWHIDVTIKYRPIRYMGWDMEERISSIRLTGDVDFVERAQKQYKEGRRVQVTGKIRAAGWGITIVPQDKRWHPKHLTISLEEPAVH
ncbi:MAG: hypothetical protein AAGI37_08700 [Planctomycetota bacterium]